MSDLLYNVDYRSKHSERLYVVAVVSNPQRFHSRYQLYQQFAKHVEKSGAQLLTVEAAFGRRHHNVTEPGNPWHVQLRTDDELWNKECMVNIGISRLPADWKYVAWIDADIEFVRPDWVTETIHQLQHFDVVQLWSDCIDLLPDYGVNQYHLSFMRSYMDWIHGRLNVEPGGDEYTTGKTPYFHAGFAWAARREAIDALGGLIDWSVCGANDHHMALALVGRLKKSIHGGCSQAFKDSLLEWEMRALKYIRLNVGYVPGTITHHWHGPKTNRQYKGRWEILTETQFDPNLDLKKDSQGLYQLTDRRGSDSVKLRDGLREYFRTRFEDSRDPNPSEKTIIPMMVERERTPVVMPPKTVEQADVSANEAPV